MTNEDFAEYYPRYGGVIRAIARKLAQRDDELVLDLEQEGAMALLFLNPKLATTNPDAWIRQAIKNRMIDYLRKLNPQKYESLDARLASGDQVHQSYTGGELFLVTHRTQLPRLHPDGER